MNPALSITRLTAIALVILGIVASSLVLCGALETTRFDTCCADSQCAPAQSSDTPNPAPYQQSCDHCNLLCKAFERPMLPVQGEPLAVVSATPACAIHSDCLLPSPAHLGAVFKPPIV